MVLAKLLHVSEASWKPELWYEVSAINPDPPLDCLTFNTDTLSSSGHPSSAKSSHFGETLRNLPLIRLMPTEAYEFCPMIDLISEFAANVPKLKIPHCFGV